MCKIKENSEAAHVISFTLKNGFTGITEPFNIDKENFTEDTARQILMTDGIDPEMVAGWYSRPYIEPDTYYITDHAMMRFKKRLGWKRNTAIRMTKKAVEEGLSGDDMKGSMKNWIDYKEGILEGKSTEGIHIKIYGQVAFIFDGQVLCTVYNVASKEVMTSYDKRRKGYNRAAQKREAMAC